MKRQVIRLLTFLCITVYPINSALGQEQNPFIRSGSVGRFSRTPQSCPKDGFSYRPITCWPGEKFIFLPKTKSLQRFGYQSVKGGQGQFGHPAYEEAVGRIGTVIEVQKKSIGWDVKIRMDDNGQEYVASASFDDPDDASVNDLAPLLDLQAARTKWRSKTLWLKTARLGSYDEAADKVGDVSVSKGGRATVTDVIAGWYEGTPVRFILSTDSGVEGFVDVNLSGTNVSRILRDFSRFDEQFFERNPRETYKWPERVWNAIASEKVFVGMTEDQAKLSWGKPKKVNRTVLSGKATEQWVYPGGYLYFEKGVLVAIQN